MREIIAFLLIASSAVCQDDPCNGFSFANNMSPNYGIAKNRRYEITIDNVDISRSYYRPYQTIKVTIRSLSEDKFTGFLIRAEANSTIEGAEQVGFFDFDPQNDRICKTSRGNSVKNYRESGWTSKSFYWRAKTSYGSVQFKAIIYEYDRKWSIVSSILKDPHVERVPKVLTFIDTEGCGVTKGCYREPSGCQDGSCSLLLAWTVEDNVVQFQMSALTNGYIALGFSKDQYMGDDSVVECVNQEETKRVIVQYSYNDGQSNKVLEQLSDFDAYQGGKIIRCEFKRRKLIRDNSEGKIFNLDESYYLLLARGSVKNGKKLMHFLRPGVEPLVSTKKVDLDSHPNLSGKARYPLVKLHGCLMLIAWMILSSMGILMARYYKPIWPNKRSCNERIWFCVHRVCMASCAILTLIGVIIIFIQVGGYSTFDDFPKKAHPPLGIIVCILSILNPLMALIRCDYNGKRKKWRVVFNWFHWLFGTITVLISMPTVFIGLSMQKAAVPSWATWVMMAFFLFHLIVELLLEIHGCINSRKQKERDERELLARQNHPSLEPPLKEPKPVGQKFKTTVLAVYVVVWFLLGVVMVIAVAAG
ncbi:DgyrCDS11159 [Dimorphilus gyrociliatus]|uniref:DgyrCDS11159 n=1 Tax=Dimorphilus gyrociliatus TaxID=2664684 RepID=A0A7I8W4Z7_9ANNE|nr:DgyrCDS11159 [Dimorphilus gyrociliatus]